MKRPGRKGQIWRTAGVFTLGAAAGGALGVLLSPVSGRTLRKRMAMKFQKLERQAGRKLRSFERTATRELGRKITTARQWLNHQLPNGHHPSRRVSRRPAVKHA